jgi:hypothetical protein
MTFWNRECWYCGYVNKTIGLDRIDSSRGYVMGNVVSCCARDNAAKSNLSQQEFFEQIKAVAKRHGLFRGESNTDA